MPEFVTFILPLALALVVGFVLFQHLLGPLLVWRQQRIPAAYDLQSVEVQPVAEALNQSAPAIIEELAAIGFVPVGASAISNDNAELSFLLLRHAGDLSVANATLASSPANIFFYIEFTQLFADGTALSVNTTPIISAYPGDARKLVYRFPAMSVNELYAAFVKLRTSLLPGKTPVLSLNMDNPVSDLSRILDDETSSLIARGYISRSVEQGAHRLTAKGALMFTWKMLWPWKPLLNLAELAASRRALDAA